MRKNANYIAFVFGNVAQQTVYFVVMVTIRAKIPVPTRLAASNFDILRKLSLQIYDRKLHEGVWACGVFNVVDDNF